MAAAYVTGFFCVKKCLFWGQHVLPLIKIRALQLMVELTSARERGKGEGCRPEGAYDVGSSRRLQSKTEQAWRGQTSCLVHLWTHQARTSFSVSAFCSLLHIPPSVCEEATPQHLHKQPRITIFPHGLTFAWARAATAKSFNLSNKYALPLGGKATLPSALLVDTFYFIN